MPGNLAPDTGVLSQSLQQVGSVFPSLDLYYGYLAPIPWNCKASWYTKSNDPSAPAGSFATVLQGGAKWYGLPLSHPHVPVPSFTATSYRSQIIEAYFGPFEAQTMEANCVVPLTKLAQIDRVLRAGGTIPTSLRDETLAALLTLSKWLSTRVAAMRDAYDKFHEAITAVSRNVPILKMEQDRSNREFVPNTFSAAHDGSWIVMMRLKGILDRLAYQMTWPISRIDLALAAVLELTQTVANRIAAANNETIGSALQELDLESAQTEWMTIAAMARSLMPAPPVPINAFPWGDIWGLPIATLLEPMTADEMKQTPPI